jgi:sulfite exporter TauE/SafE
MTEFFHSLAAFCGVGAAPPTLGIGLVPGLLLVGAAGSAMHCAPMCGPFVLAQAADRLARVPAARLCEAARLRSGLLPSYHCGRLTTYALLGAAAGLLGGTLAYFPGAARVSGLLLLVAASLFLLQAVQRLGLRVPFRLHRAGAGTWPRLTARFAARLRRIAPNAGFLIGVSLGFLPCGLLYGALTAAAASGSAWWGALAMLAFGAGTVPALVIVGVAGTAAGQVWNRTLARLTPFLLGANAAVLALLGLVRLIG